MCLSDRNTACTQRQEVGVLNYDGGYAEYVTLKSQFVHRIPENLSLISASSIEPLAVVHKGFARIGLNKLSESEKTNILVVGGGPVGHFSARLGHLWGHEVTVYDNNEDRLALFSDIPISPISNKPDYRSFSVIIECTGDAELASQLINDTSASTTILLMGLPYDNKVINLEEIVSFDKKIIGSVGSTGDDFKAAMKISAEINMNHFNTTTFDFNDWSKAWDLHKTKQKLKVKLKIGH
jgi:threonine dehydrogenase-like Zn-dependent dehydrogenase